MTLVAYFPEGAEVEAKRTPDGEWESAKLDRVDRDDDSLPYGVRWTSNNEFDWVRANEVRMPVPAVEPPKVKQYRFRNGSRWLDWQVYGEHQVVPIMHAYSAMQFREITERSDAEIVARLRERGAGTGRITMTEVQAIVQGNF